MMKRNVASTTRLRLAPRPARRLKAAAGCCLLVAAVAGLAPPAVKAQCARVGVNAPPADAPESARLVEVNDAIAAAYAATPELKGFKDVEAITSSAFKGRSKEDLNLLAGRLYYDEAQRARGRWHSPAQLKQKVSRTLAKGWPAGRYDRAFYDRLLEDTKRRMARDQKYRKAIEDSASAAQSPARKNWGSWTCVIDGWSSPMSACVSLLNHWLWSEL